MMILTENKLREIITEEMTKGEISALIASKLGDNLNSREFKRKALEFSKDKTFRASKGWLQKFRRRHNRML